jgi:Holliday junction DNA helicase RuvB
MFLTEIMYSIKKSYFTVGSNTTKAGLINQLFEKEPKYLLIDELDKMSGNDQVSLLHLMETGIISETKISKTRQMELTSWVFATANSCEKIIQPLLSRFAVLEISEYAFKEFTEIALAKLAKERVDERLARVIAEKVWNELGSRDIRDVIKIARLSGSSDEVHYVVKMLNKQERLGGMNNS